MQRGVESCAIALRELWSRPDGASSTRAVAAAAAFLLSFYVGLALAYRDAIPLFEAPDEPSHLHYAAFIYSEGRLPRQDPLEVPGEGMQPPLVYLIAAPLLGRTGLDVAAASADLHQLGLYLYHLGDATRGGPRISVLTRGHRRFVTDGSLNALHVVRGTSLAFGLLAVIFTFTAVWRLSHDARLSLLVGALTAFNPQFLFVSGYFSNDAAAAAVGAAALWVVAGAIAQGGPSRGHYLSGAVVIALGVLTKLSTLPSLAVAAVTVAALDRRERSARVLDLALATAVVLVLAGPYLHWAAEHRGGLLGIDAVTASAVGMQRPEHEGGLFLYLAKFYWVWTFSSYWSRFGWLNVAVPNLVYLAFFALTWAGVLGFFAGRSSLPARLAWRTLRGYLLASIAATLAAHLLLNLMIVAAQGRQLFASAPQIAFLLALGIYRLVGSERRMFPLAMSIAAGLIAVDVYCLRAVLEPAYWMD